MWMAPKYIAKVEVKWCKFLAKMTFRHSSEIKRLYANNEMTNGAELGGATGAIAPLVFWSRSLKKS